MQVHTPPMRFKDAEAQKNWERGLEKNRDPYGYAVYRFASEWATRMERAIESGETVSQCMDRIGHEADDEGISGFMYGVAVNLLAGLWKYGEELRQKHNLDTQIENEGEEANKKPGVTLNPALLKVVVREPSNTEQ